MVQVLVSSIPENFLFHVDIRTKKVLKSSKNFIVLSMLSGVSVFVIHFTLSKLKYKVYRKLLSKARKKDILLRKKNEL